VKKIAVLDRTKEPGSEGEPLYEDVVTSCAILTQGGTAPWGKAVPIIVGGRYGIGSKEFTPAMVKAVYDNLGKDVPMNKFVVGIEDDVLGTSLPVDESFHIVEEGMTQCMFYGLGSDGTVGANKNSIKIIGDARPDLNAQAYFSYDSKKSGGYTVSHLRFGKKPIRRPYLITKADFLACHKFSYMETYDMLANVKDGGTFLLNSPFSAEEVWANIPVEQQQKIIDKKLKFYVIDAAEIARSTGMGKRINTVMQAAYFKLANVLPREEAVKEMKHFIEKSYGKKGKDVVEKNYKTVDASLDAVREVTVPAKADGKLHMKPAMSYAGAHKMSEGSGDTVGANWKIMDVEGKMASLDGDKLPVSAIPADGTFPSGTTKFEKRGVAERVPHWDPKVCIQCGQCSMVCSHACIRMKKVSDADAAKLPAGLPAADPKPKADGKVVLAISAADCMECGVCIANCPMSQKPDTPHALSWHDYSSDVGYAEESAKAWDAFMKLPETELGEKDLGSVKGLAFKKPLFEFSGACGGCGETPYVKLLSQLFGDRAVIANATGCSSIYGGNLPTTPYAQRADGRGPVWSNSLFEDAAEFGYGMRLTSDKLGVEAHEIAEKAKSEGICVDLVNKVLANKQEDEDGIEQMRKDKDALKAALKANGSDTAKQLYSLCDYFVKRSVWILGGDGWGYDIGYGGLDHVLAQGRNVNVLCLDTEVYSNTGGQMSKATPVGAVAQFAASGKENVKKDLGGMAMTYGYVYVAKVCLGADINQTIKAIREAES
jgi:pyruvate-ferredoxin/flavodoxin oxidoreductase